MNVQQIYVELLDEGVIVYRPVSATKIRDGIYRIEGVIPETETWAFAPGQIVECELRTFDDVRRELAAIRLVTQDKIGNQ